jgi:hypothetical protein
MDDEMNEYPITVEYAPVLDSVSESLEADLTAILLLISNIHVKLQDNSP